jgi:ribonuclease D
VRRPAIELLRVLLKLTVEKENVAAKIIATADDLEAIAVDGEMPMWPRSRAGGANCSASGRSS